MAKTPDEVVANMLAGLDPDAEGVLCAGGCGTRISAKTPGVHDGHCHDCASAKRRAGEWHTPDLTEPIEQTRCPVCGWHQELARTKLDKQRCAKCDAEYIPAMQG